MFSIILGVLLCILGSLNCLVSFMNVVNGVPHPHANGQGPHVANFALWCLVLAGGIIILRGFNCHG